MEAQSTMAKESEPARHVLRGHIRHHLQSAPLANVAQAFQIFGPIMQVIIHHTR